MGVTFYARGKIDAHRTSHRRGFFCFCGQLKGLPSEANKNWPTLTHDDVKKLFQLSLTSYGIPVRLPFRDIKHNLHTFIDAPYPHNLCNDYITFLEFQFFLNLNMPQLQLWCGLVDEVDFTLSFPPNIDHVYIDSVMTENNTQVLNTSTQTDEDSLDFLFV